MPCVPCLLWQPLWPWQIFGLYRSQKPARPFAACFRSTKLHAFFRKSMGSSAQSFEQSCHLPKSCNTTGTVYPSQGLISCNTAWFFIVYHTQDIFMTLLSWDSKDTNTKLCICSEWSKKIWPLRLHIQFACNCVSIYIIMVKVTDAYLSYVKDVWCP